MSTITTQADIIIAVEAEAEQLKSFTTHGDLYRWAKDRGFDGKFAMYKTALKRIGIDYEAIREETTRQRLAELNAQAGEGVPSIRLNAAGLDPEGDATGTYAVCDTEGTVLWYGSFHERDIHYRKGSQVSADTAAANKAIFLAGQARQHAQSDLARLHLTIANPHVDTNQLIREATSWRLLLQLDINDDPATPPPASSWCEESGFQNWKDADLAALVEAPDTDAEQQ